MSKHYVVWRGYTPGVYASWEECQNQVNGFKGALYKSYPDKAQAEAAYIAGAEGAASATAKMNAMPEKSDSLVTDRPVPPYITADASYSHGTYILEWRVVLVNADGSQEQVFHSKRYSSGSANIGEFLGVIEAYRYLARNELVMPVYSDSITAQAWIRNRAIKSTVYICYDLDIVVNQSLRSLQNGAFDAIQKTCPLFDWKTNEWGEIPADFGRK